MNINIIDTPDFNALGQCTFYSNGEKALVQTFTDGVQGIAVGPPQAITGVSCVGTCIYNYSEYFSLPAIGHGKERREGDRE